MSMNYNLFLKMLDDIAKIYPAGLFSFLKEGYNYLYIKLENTWKEFENMENLSNWQMKETIKKYRFQLNAGIRIYKRR